MAAVDGMAAAVGAEGDGAAAVGTVATTAVAGTGMLATTDGTGDGAGGAVAGIRGGLFRCPSLILITGGTTDPATDTARDMGMARATVTGTDAFSRCRKFASGEAKSVVSSPLSAKDDAAARWRLSPIGRK